MKRTAFALRGITHPRNSRLLLLLVPIFFQSCAVVLVQASADVNRQRFSGPSYPNSSPDRMSLGENIGMVLETPDGGFSNSAKDPGAFNGSNERNLGKPYADNSRGIPVFFNKGEHESGETVQLSKNKTSPDLMSHIRFMGGIEWIKKRSKDGGTKIALNYLQVPLYALYNYKLSPRGNIFGGLGPYLAYGIGGKMKSNYSGRTSETKSFDKTSGFKRFDGGLGITAGYEITNSFSFSLAIDHGFVNIERNAFGDKTKNRSISLNIRYPLDKIIKKADRKK